MWPTCTRERRAGRSLRANALRLLPLFEHDPADPDEECQAGGCPSASLAGGRDHVIETAAELALETAQGAPWANDALPSYLEAFSAWLADSGGSHANQRRVPAGNGWEVVADALRAATVYE